MAIPFNRPVVLPEQIRTFEQVLEKKKFSGDQYFTQQCHQWFESQLGCPKALLTTSCTHALEMCAMLLGIQPGDEVIMPSYNFVSGANAFVLRGAKIRFVDIRQDTLNIDERLIEAAISKNTKAIVVVHYAGVGCEMDEIMRIAQKHNIPVVEDAAQGIMSQYKGKPLGTIGSLGTISFHETKNCHCGEGGLLIINDSKFVSRAEIIREKGTNRGSFFRGEVDKYSWVDIGSSYLPSEFNASYLYPQLCAIKDITNNRLATWQYYRESLEPLAEKKLLDLPHIPSGCEHNGHIFHIRMADLEQRQNMIAHLKTKGVQAVFHYVPLHSSLGGKQHSIFVGEDTYTTQESERLIRLPLYYDMSAEEQSQVVEAVKGFFTF